MRDRINKSREDSRSCVKSKMFSEEGGVQKIMLQMLIEKSKVRNDVCGYMIYDVRVCCESGLCV